MLPLFLCGYCIRGVNESAVVSWSPEGKRRGANGALMEISRLLINVETYTNHVDGRRREKQCEPTHMQGKTDGFTKSLSSFVSSLFCLLEPSVTHVRKNNYGSSLSVSLHYYSETLLKFAIVFSQ